MPRHPDRSLRLSGASNFRDLGGYTGAGGRTVRWRRVFRSDHLAALTPGDAAALRELGVARVFDFRGASERDALRYDLPGVAQHPLPIEPTVVQRMKDLVEAGQRVTPEQTVGLMQQTYHAFVHDNAARFAGLFAHMLESDAPLVFHCTAGKDRTGFAAALILRALGVPEPVVMQDYLLTNDLYRMPEFGASDVPQEVLNVLWRVQEEFLRAALDAVEEDFGGVDRYLAEQLGVGPRERERLAELYLMAG
ncbi:tyrosine-protein phosphatase [Ottowia sp.]|uniref:tyrosine-protein phosphatase n=1 Tax=Ottowia sp. TaxID=1898956 RepID=UPI001DC655C3|nr:tyrosine-protein phosphatase [Ottowia sp.]MCB2025012.1 tyrosine-protein phosphatase [Ottowia sp.]MCP5257145.1 tyrosine-protein phosphatase [Burkholderiaceae bacterium]HRW71555.1 tyrosine-protein phosphatase [Ottowia sp.]